MKKEKIINTLKGACAGDAFGVVIEFSSRERIKSEITYDQFHVWRSDFKGSKFEPGSYSDDAEHTLALAGTCIYSNNFNPDIVAEGFKSIYLYDKTQKGYGRYGHGSIIDWYEDRKSLEFVRNGQRRRSPDPGNAPVMRILPIAMLPKELQFEYATISALSTHRSLMGIEAAILSATACGYIIDNGPKEWLIDYLIKEMEPRFHNDLIMVDSLPHPDHMTESDYVKLLGPQPMLFAPAKMTVFGLPCQAMITTLAAIYVLKHASSAFEALKFSVVLGGDIDSLACVCVGAAAGAYGMDSLPTFLTSKTEGMERCETLGEAFYNKYYLPK